MVSSEWFNDCMNVNFTRLLRTAYSVYRQVKRHSGGSAGSHQGTSAGGRGSAATSTVPTGSAAGRGATSRGPSELSRPYPVDYTGRVTASYDPHPDGRADPGEIVWTWVPYQEDHSRGKDRPVLIVGRSGDYLLALMLTSKDHNNARQRDEDYVDIGTGDWDRQGRPSEVRVDRVIQVLEDDVRREGSVLSRDRFNAVAQALGA